MLVVSRKLGQKVYIGENVSITVVMIDRGKVRLGIEAPRDIPVYREELLQRESLPYQTPQPPAATQEASQ